MVKKFRKRPLVIDAIQWTEDNKNEVLEFVGEDGYYTELIGAREGPAFVLQTLEGRAFVMPDDWVIRGIKNEIYPCKPDIFEETYEEV